VYWRRFRAAGASDDSDDASSSSAADSDDDEEEDDGHARRRGGGFNAAYASALDAQLRGTAMASDFVRASAAPAADAAAAAVDGEEDEDDSRPVDVDLNLVQSLLASYTAQEGLPGPASNLLGLMGLALPHDADARPAGSAAADAGT
jgi:hypothetical protein